ncbi:hypothetical protein [Metabacillus fastidiosus]|uniref:hypothetical protein n=1 Tax=Metabacillus fastidiosus TaxID=1458 RepID=UPI003D28EA28
MQCGDWIEATLPNRRVFGYVTNIIDKYVYVRKVKIIHLHNLETVNMYGDNQSAYLIDNVKLWGNSLLSNDYTELINIAIDRKDEAWFHELAGRLISNG